MCFFFTSLDAFDVAFSREFDDLLGSFVTSIQHTAYSRISNVQFVEGHGFEFQNVLFVVPCS